MPCRRHGGSVQQRHVHVYRVGDCLDRWYVEPVVDHNSTAFFYRFPSVPSDRRYR